MNDIIIDLLKTQQSIIKEIQQSLAENHAKESQIMSDALTLLAGARNTVVALETLDQEKADPQSLREPANKENTNNNTPSA